MSRQSSAWMPFYVGDYLGDTQRLTTEQHGAYLLLILDYWRNGPAPDDDAVLQQITKLDAKSWKKHRSALARMFQVENDEWRHRRIDKELDGAAARAEKGKAGSDAKWGASSSGEKGKHLRSQRLTEARRKGTHTPEQWFALKQFCGCCVRCGIDDELVKDHITPIYQGGSDGIDNIQPLCRKCNASKGPEAADHRPDGWQNACVEGVKRPQNATESQSPSPKKDISDAYASSPQISEIEIGQEAPQPANDTPGVEPSHVIDEWNKIAVAKGLPQVKAITGSRLRQLNARIREHSLSDWMDAFDAIERNPWMHGDNDRGWRADFDFMLQPSSFQKLIEGSYDRAQSVQRAQ